MDSFSEQPGTRKVEPMWILMTQEMMRWQWHQLDHMQITCTSLQTDNHASTSSLNFGQAGYSSSSRTPNQRCQGTAGRTHSLTIIMIITIGLMIVLATYSNSWKWQATADVDFEQAGISFTIRMMWTGLQCIFAFNKAGCLLSSDSLSKIWTLWLIGLIGDLLLK